MRTLQVGDQPTRLAQAIAEHGRIDKTLHTLRYIDDEAKRRGTLIQLKIVLWNSLYMQAALSQLGGQGYPVNDDDVARLSPLLHEHINMLGRYSFLVPDAIAKGELRALRDPADGLA